MAFSGESVLTNNQAVRAVSAAAFLKTLVLCFMLLAAPAVAFPISGLVESAAGKAAGFKTDSIRPLKVGDKLPEALLKEALQVVSTQAPNTQFLQLEEFAKGTLILDFWATWCLPCIRSLGELDSLQQVFGEELKILPVSYQTAAEAKALFSKRGWTLPSLVEDDVLGAYFPREGLPHQVWIRDGVVVALTGGQYATADNLWALIRDEELHILQKEDVAFDKSQPLLSPDNAAAKLMPIHQSLFTARLPAQIAGIVRRPDRLMLYNSDLIGLLMEAFRPEIAQPAQIRWQSERLKREEVAGKGRMITGDLEKDRKVMEWANRYQYCYELIVPDSLPLPARRALMQEDLVRFLRLKHNLIAERKDTLLSCLRLEQLGGGNKVGETGNLSSTAVLGFLRRWLLQEVLVDGIKIPKTAITKMPDLQGRNRDDINKFLRDHGLTLVPARETVPVILINDLNPNP